MRGGAEVGVRMPRPARAAEPRERGPVMVEGREGRTTGGWPSGR